RRTGFVNEDGIDLVNDGIVVPALHAIFDVELHVVAQIVESKLVVGPVSNVSGVRGPALFIVEIMDNDTDRQSQEAVEPAHPFGVALGQVVVDRDNMDATT